MTSDPAEQLYALPLAEFTPARDALAKELKAAGDREAAAAVKGLRKPSVGAWAINAAGRAEPAALRALLQAGDELRAAQERLLGGRGDRAELRRAAETERAAVAAMTDAALAAAREAGQPLSPAVQARVRETLHAVALQDDVRDAVAGGRLVREAEAAGFPGGPAEAAANARPPRDQADAAGAASAKRGRSTDRRREPDALATALRKQRESARAELSAANRTLREAERVADAAGRRLERAEAAVEQARRRLVEAEQREQAERAACADAQRELRAAKAAAAAAQAALDAAEA